MGRKAVLLAVTALAVSLGPASSAFATGAGGLQFSAQGTLNPYPCANGGCSAGFTSSSGSGSGTVEGPDGKVATFEMVGQIMHGGIKYTEPSTPPFCPTFGSANDTGDFTISGTSSGVVYNTNPSLINSQGLQGTVSSVTEAVTFQYTRIGTAVAIVITGGTITINYNFPSSSGTILQRIQPDQGAAAGQLIVFDPVTLARGCLGSPGALGFNLVGAGAAVAG